MQALELCAVEIIFPNAINQGDNTSFVLFFKFYLLMLDRVIRPRRSSNREGFSFRSELYFERQTIFINTKEHRRQLLFAGNILNGQNAALCVDDLTALRPTSAHWKPNSEQRLLRTMKLESFLVQSNLRRVFWRYIDKF